MNIGSSFASLRWRAADLAVVLLAPLAVWWLFRVKMFMQVTYADPWFYTGAGQEFVTLAQHYGWAYYYVRFPVMFLNTLFCGGDNPDIGFMVLRYLLIVASGGVLYAMALSRFGRTAAVASYLFLFLNPQYLSVVNWDLTPFLSVPATLAGASLWLYRGGWQLTRCSIAGALFCVAVNCHIFTVTAVGCFSAGLLVAHLWCRSSWRSWLTEFGGAALGFVLMWTAGWLYYRSLFGASANFLLFWEVNWRTLQAGSDYAVSHAFPFERWWASHTYVYVPYLFLAGALLAARRRIGRSAHDYALLLGPTLLLTFYYFYRFGMQRFVFEESTYFGHVWALTPLLIPVLVVGAHKGEKRSATIGWVAVLLVVVATLVVTIWANQKAVPIWGYFTAYQWPVVAALLIAVGGLIALELTRRTVARWLAIVGIALAVQALSLTPAVGSRMYGNQDEARQRAVYLGATQYTRLWGKYTRAGEPPLLWFSSSTTDYDIYSIAFATLGNTLHNIWNVSGMPEYGEFERTRFDERQPKVLFLIAKRPEEIEAGRASLARAGHAWSTVEKVTVGTTQFPIGIEVVRLGGNP